MIKKAMTAALSAALTFPQAAAARAEAPASQLAQAQTIMDAQASSEAKLDILYNGGSAKQLGVAVPAASADGARHLDFGAATGANAALGPASIPSLAAATAQGQARVGFWDTGVLGLTQTESIIAGVVIIGAIIYVSQAYPQGYGSGKTDGYRAGYADGVATTPYAPNYNQGAAAGQAAGYPQGYSAGVADRIAADYRCHGRGCNDY